MKYAWVLGALLLAVIPAKADTVHVNAWALDFNGGSQIFWTFGQGLGGPAPVDPNPTDQAFYGYALPFNVEDSRVGGVDTFFATYNIDSPPTLPTTYPYPLRTFDGDVTLTDVNGFVAGLPFECVQACQNVIYSPNSGLAEFAWLNQSLDPPSPTPEPSSLALMGVGLVGIVSLRKLLIA